MREIKFRVWNKTTGEYGYTDKGLKLIFPNILVNKHLVIEQYTGLKDKNGQEVYEGDLVKNKYGKILKIEFSSGSFIFGNYYFGSIGFGKPVEVVGNIHENADLLEES